MIFICPRGDRTFSTRSGRCCPMCGSSYRRIYDDAVGLILSGYTCHEELASEETAGENDSSSTRDMKDDGDTITISDGGARLSPEETERRIRKYFESMGSGDGPEY